MNYSIITYVLGWILTAESAFLVLPVLVSLMYQEFDSTAGFVITASISFLVGIIRIRKKPDVMSFFAREGFVTVALSWIVMSIMGALPFVINHEIPSFVDALFEVVSGFTTTGASILPDVESLSHAALFWRSFTHWIGGMGVFVFLLAILPLAGANNMHLMRAESPGPSVGKLVPKVKKTAKILYEIYIAMTLIEVVLLLIAGLNLFEALTLSFGTAGTGGFSLLSSGIASYSTPVQVIISIFMVLFGVNFGAYFFIINKKPKDALKMEEVRWYLIIIAVSTLIITGNIADRFASVLHALQQAFFQVSSIITTTGYATADFNTWPELSRTILVIIMFIGACAGSTGGGIKVSRIIILIKGVKQEIKRFIHPRSILSAKLDGKTIDKGSLQSVSMFIVTYFIIFTASVFIVSLNNFDQITTFTAVTATINNIGPGLEMVGPYGSFGDFSILSKLVLIFDMLAGRLELYPLILIFVPEVWKKK